MPGTQVIIADSEPLFSEALALALEHYQSLIIQDVRPKSGAELIQVVIDLQPDVVLAEYWLRGIQGPAATAAIAASGAPSRMILLAWMYGPREIAYAFASGAAGFVPKSASLEEVFQAIREVAEGAERVCPESIGNIARQPSETHAEAAGTWRELRTLTFREFQILNMLGAGKDMKDITKALGIRPSTAQTHIHRILEKTGTANRHQAAALARSYGLAPP